VHFFSGEAKLKGINTKINSAKNGEDFFLIGPLGFEASFESEIKKVQPWILGADSRPTPFTIEIVNVRKGGLELRTPKLEGFQLVHHLKSPVRLLWRWKSKNISHVAELKSYIRGLRPQEIWDGPLRVQISSRKSRLNNEKMIERVFYEEWKFLTDEAKQSLYVDVFEDQFTLSWDVCGEPLYKRAWTPVKGEAPIRENLAHLLLEDLTAGFTGPELSQMTLIDPMMGSGTFLWEAMGWNRPSIAREFAYQDWKGIPGLLKTEWWKNLRTPSEGLFKNYLGLDQSSKMVELAKQNAAGFGEQKIQLRVQNVLENLAEDSPENSLLISNPPYGERLAVDSVEKLIQASLKNHRPRKALFVWPEGKIPQITGYQSELVRNFSQGGIPVQVVIFSRSI
jgi:putative N6-adenine-specific DNA methylase